MKVTIKKDEKNRHIGWDMKAETKEEILIVNSIRNMQFFGIGDTVIEYNGRTGGSHDNSDAGTLHWIQKKHQ